MATNISPKTAEKMGRAAAHMGLSEQQLTAMFEALGHGSIAMIAQYSETVRRNHLLWIAETLGRGQPVDGLVRRPR